MQWSYTGHRSFVFHSLEEKIRRYYWARDLFIKWKNLNILARKWIYDFVAFFIAELCTQNACWKYLLILAVYSMFCTKKNWNADFSYYKYSWHTNNHRLKSNPLAAYISLCWVWVGWKLVQFMKRSYKSIGNNTRRSCAFQLHFGCSPLDFKFDLNRWAHLNIVAQCTRCTPNEVCAYDIIGKIIPKKHHQSYVSCPLRLIFISKKTWRFHVPFICRSYIPLGHLLNLVHVITVSWGEWTQKWKCLLTKLPFLLLNYISLLSINENS